MNAIVMVFHSCMCVEERLTICPQYLCAKNLVSCGHNLFRLRIGMRYCNYAGIIFSIMHGIIILVRILLVFCKQIFKESKTFKFFKRSLKTK